MEVRSTFQRLRRLFSKKKESEELVPVFVPSLIAVLQSYQDKRLEPLTEAEVLSIRDKSTVVMLTREMAEKMDADRGYKDIDPQLCWLEWRMMQWAEGTIEVKQAEPGATDNPDDAQ